MKRFTQKLSAVLAIVLLMEEVFCCLPVSGNELPADADFLPAQVFSEEVISDEVISEEDMEFSESAEKFPEEIDGEEVIEVMNPVKQPDFEPEVTGAERFDAENVEAVATPSFAAAREVQTVYWAINGTELRISSTVQEGEYEGQFLPDEQFTHEGGTNAIWGNRTIKSLIVGSLLTGDVVIPSGEHLNWFGNLKDLEKADCRGLDISGAADLSGLFSGCAQLKTVSFGDWDTSSVKDMSSMFSGCSSLTKIETVENGVVPEGFYELGTMTVPAYYGDEYTIPTIYCNQISIGNEVAAVLKRPSTVSYDTMVSYWNKHVSEAVYDEGTYVVPIYRAEAWKDAGYGEVWVACWGYDRAIAPDTYGNPAGSVGLYMPERTGKNKFYTKTGLHYNWSGKDESSLYGIYSYNPYVKDNFVANHAFIDKIEVSVGETAAYQFNGAGTSFPEVITGSGHWATPLRSKVTILSNGNITTSESGKTIGDWDTSSVTDMSSMFAGCSSLKKLDIGGWNTSSVTDMSSMFSGCSALRTINIGDWDTSSVTDMSSMFAGCSGLVQLDIEEYKGGGDTVPEGTYELRSMTVPAYYGDEYTIPTIYCNQISIGNEVAAVLKRPSTVSYDTMVSYWNKHVSEAVYDEGTYVVPIYRAEAWKDAGYGEVWVACWGYDRAIAPDTYGNPAGSVGLYMPERTGKNKFYTQTGLHYNWRGKDESSLYGIYSYNPYVKDNFVVNHAFIDTIEVSVGETATYDLNGAGTSFPEVITGSGHWATPLRSTVTLLSNGNITTSESGKTIGDWDTSSVKDMSSMFSGCSKLEAIDISGWNTTSVSYSSIDMELSTCTSLNRVLFPAGLKFYISLPSGGTWYYNGAAVTALPQNAAEPGVVTRDGTRVVVFRYLNQKGNWTNTVAAVNSGGGATAPNVPEQVGSNVFAGWQNNLYKTTTESLEVKALYVTCEDPASVTWHKLRFYDGSSLFAEQIVKHGTAGQDPGEPVSDQPFYGWSGSYSCITKDTDLYAQRQQKFNVVFTDYDGTEDIYTVSGTDVVTAPSGAQREGYRFMYWKEAGGSTVQAGGKVSGITKNLSYTAVYEKRCTATFNYRNANGILVSEERDVNENGTVSAPQVPSSYTVSGGEVLYVFNGWSRALTGITADTVINALYTEKYRASFAVGDEVIKKYFASGEKVVYPTEEELEALGYGTEASIRAYINGGAEILSKAAPAGNEPEGELYGSPTLYGASMADVINRFKGVFLGWNSTTAVMPAYAVTIKAEVKTGNGFRDQLKKWFGITVTVTVKYYGTKSGSETYVTDLWKGEQVNFDSAEYKALYPLKNGYELKGTNPYIETSFQKDMSITLNYYERYDVVFREHDGKEKVRYSKLWGDTHTAPQRSDREGYEFLWWKEAGGSKLEAGKVLTVKGSLTYTAEYEKLCKVTFFYYTQSGTWKAEQHYVKKGSTAEAVAPAPSATVQNPRKRFDGWDTDLKKAVNEDIEIRGKYTDIFIVEFIYHSGEDGEEKHTVKTVEKGADVSAPFIRESYKAYGDGYTASYRFVGWYSGETMLSNTVSLKLPAITEDMKVTAKYRVTGISADVDAESDRTMIQAVNEMAEWYLNHVSTYWCEVSKNWEGKYVATKEAVQYKEDNLKTVKTDEIDRYGNKIEIIAESNDYVKKSVTGRAMYVCDLFDDMKHHKVGDDCSGFAMACIYLATDGAFEADLNDADENVRPLDDCDSGTFAYSYEDKLKNFGFVSFNAEDMEIQDLQPGDILVDRHKKMVKNPDGSLKEKEIGHVELVYSEPEKTIDGKWVVSQTFGWGQVQNACPKNNTISKVSRSAFGDNSHINYRWVLRKVR